MSKFFDLISDVVLGRYDTAPTDTLSVPPDSDTVGEVHSRQEKQAAFERGTELLAAADARQG